MNGYWGAWAAIAFTAFAVPEMIAVFTGHPDRKLSSAVWSAMDSLPAPLAWRIAAVVVIAVVAFHLLFGPRH